MQPLAYTGLGRVMAAGAEMIERSTRHYAKPQFKLPPTLIDDDGASPRSMLLMGRALDTRVNPTKVHLHAAKHSLEWFERACVSTVPAAYPGFMRRVYPGFLQLTSFMAMNADRHFGSALKHF